MNEESVLTVIYFTSFAALMFALCAAFLQSDYAMELGKYLDMYCNFIIERIGL
jgi:hypothetical protein